MKLLGKLLLFVVLGLLVLGLVFHKRIADLIDQASPVEYRLPAHIEPRLSAGLPDDAKWQPLFNGKNLEGWNAKFTGFPAGENYKNTFRANDGVLKVDYSDWTAFDGEFGHLFTESSYSRYILRFEYRFVGDQVQGAGSNMAWALRNNGAMLHAQTPASMSLEQEFPVSIEAQLLGGLGSEQGERATANLCTPATNVSLNGEVYRAHCTNSVSATYHGDQWVEAEFEVLGSERIRHFINGELVMQYENPQYDPYSKDSANIGKTDELLDTGHIAIQAESHPTEFRNIRILELP